MKPEQQQYIQEQSRIRTETGKPVERVEQPAPAKDTQPAGDGEAATQTKTRPAKGGKSKE